MLGKDIRTDHKIYVMEIIKNQLIEFGVTKLKKDGLTGLNNKNLFENSVYKHYFKKVIISLRGENEFTDNVIQELLTELE